MNRAPDPEGYWSEVRAEGPVYGTSEAAQYVLGTFQTISPILALRWLQGEALRIADRLDPDPTHSPWVQPAMRTAIVPVPDCPTDLRVWAEDPEEQRAARDHIKAGHPLFVKVPDADCTYTLCVWPVRLPAGEPEPGLPEPIRQRIGGLSHPLYVLAKNPWRVPGIHP
ncbi:hypothetical protein ACIQNU_05635 [Streptomyces sp. NPDC091292]|uniref:hypothetical protein n=1 Tax=Streptomyces sp. NPDC091292 TaxID=3365991 RepID=UPI003821C7CA